VSAASKPLSLTPTVATFSASRQPLVACHHSLAESTNSLSHPPSLPSPPAITSFASFDHSPAIHEQRVWAPTIIYSLLAWQDIPLPGQDIPLPMQEKRTARQNNSLPMQEKRTARQNNSLPLQEKRTARHDIRNSRFAIHKSAHATIISHLET